MSSKGHQLITFGSFDGRIRKWDLITGINTKTPYNAVAKIDFKFHVPIETSDTTLALDQEVVFIPSKSNIHMYKISDGKSMNRLTGHFKSVTSLAFSRGRFELFSGSSDRAILIWDCDRTKEALFGDEQKRDASKSSGSNATDRNVRSNDLTQDAWSSSDED